jgi:serine/tyrosine/threonine adenylyltransferase
LLAPQLVLACPHNRIEELFVVSQPIPSIPFDNRYVCLPERFYARVDPTPVKAPKPLQFNLELASFLGLEGWSFQDAGCVAALAGNAIVEGSKPLAMAYAGYQFGHWVPQLGDGRAILLGEVKASDGLRYDVQLKGSGPTPFSRRGDGRAAVGPVLREYLVSEAMAALGVATTRSLAAVASGESIARRGLLPGAVLTRVARSHVRVGTFQYFAKRQDHEAVRTLADFVLERHYPSLRDSEQPYVALLRGIVAKQAELISSWQRIGFIHGVMNTDNCSVGGETIDYGPCAFVDAFHPTTVFSSIDRMGRYAYQNQPRMGHWNMACLAECLLPLFADEEKVAVGLAQEALDVFPQRFEAAEAAGWTAKIGLAGAGASDLRLARELLAVMAESRADFTLVFSELSALSQLARDEDVQFLELFANQEGIQDWLARWRKRLLETGSEDGRRREAMQATNPRYIPRNHRVEQALQAAESGDLAPFERLLAIVQRPFDVQAESQAYRAAPTPDEQVLETFCGT